MQLNSGSLPDSLVHYNVYCMQTNESCLAKRWLMLCKNIKCQSIVSLSCINIKCLRQLTRCVCVVSQHFSWYSVDTGQFRDRFSGLGRCKRASSVIIDVVS